MQDTCGPPRLQVSTHPSGAPPLQSVLRTGCAGHCGNLRLYTKNPEKKSVSWQVTEYMKQRTANSDVLRFGDKEVCDATSSKEGPQRPENLENKSGN